MTKYLIEVPHEAKKEACEQAVQIFLNTGSHFLTNADWGCKDDEHKAWLILDIENKEDARNILPPAFRRQAKVIKLVKFSTDDMEKNMEYHV
ncbi:MAG TPA: hypothetical protein VMW28_00740 [Pelolinea sp.]|nr:hypothetical protein [Pelolinea sp.]